MNQQILPGCALGLTSEDLSAWRDETLPTEEATRIAAHSEACPACQDRLGGFEAVANALIAQRVPVPDERLWQSVLAAITTEGEEPRTSTISDETTYHNDTDTGAPTAAPERPARQHSRRRLFGVIAAAALALVVVGFGQLFHAGPGQRQPTPQLTQTTAPTATPQPTPTGNADTVTPLAWQAINQPSGFQPQRVITNSLALAPSDGLTVYACGQPNANANPPDAQIHAWATHDGGASWTTLPLPQINGWCSIVVNEVDANDLLLSARTASVASAYYRSIDGGQTWQQISALDGSYIQQFASFMDTIYALRSPNVNSTTSKIELQASTDNMATWHSIDGALLAGGVRPHEFWLNPYSGTLLATDRVATLPGVGTGEGSARLWSSTDGGEHWQALQTPAGYSTVLVQPPESNHAFGHTWGVCLADGTGSNKGLTCNTDITGHTWQTIPPVYLGDGGTHTVLYAAYTLSGAILAISPTTQTISGSSTYKVFVLLPKALQWQSIGSTPEFSLRYVPVYSGGDGELWSIPVNGVNADAQARMFTVAAP